VRHNPHIEHGDARRRGYLVVVVTPEGTVARLRAPDDPTDRQTTVATPATFTIEAAARARIGRGSTAQRGEGANQGRSRQMSSDRRLYCGHRATRDVQRAAGRAGTLGVAGGFDVTTATANIGTAAGRLDTDDL
jgi:hypothetical protein